MDRFDQFIAASVRLTGYKQTELLGTGAAEQYLQMLCDAVPVAVLDRFLGAVASASSDEALARCVMADPTFGPIAKNINVMWYCGTWQKLPDAWLAANGGSAIDTRVVSANAYLSGLQWKVARAHAPGGNMQGFASWSFPPEGEP